jgi:hypothetical protein
MPTATSWLVVIDGRSLFADTFQNYASGELPHDGVEHLWFKCSSFTPGAPFCSLRFSPESLSDQPPEETPRVCPENYVPHQAVLLATQSLPDEQPFGFLRGTQS